MTDFLRRHCAQTFALGSCERGGEIAPAPGVDRDDRVPLARGALRAGRRKSAGARVAFGLEETQKLRGGAAHVIGKMPAVARFELRCEGRLHRLIELCAPRDESAEQRELLLGEARRDRGAP